MGSKAKGKRPLYVVKFRDTHGEGYYSANHSWRAVPREMADEMFHKDALLIRNHLNQPRIGLHAAIEPATDY